MKLSTIAFRNITRRKGRAALVVAGLTVGITALVAVTTATKSFSENVSKELDTYSFNIVAYPASANLSLTYGGMTVSGVNVSQRAALSWSDVEKIRSLPEAKYLAAISPKALRTVDVGKERALVVGVDFKAERSVKKWWKVTGGMPATVDEVLVGSTAAKTLKVKAGDTLAVNGTNLRVAGILAETGSQDDGVVIADIKRTQALLGRPRDIELIEMVAKDGSDVDKIVSAASKALPEASVSSVKQAAEYKKSTMAALGRFGLGVTAIVVVVAGFVVFATLMGSVRDRTSEIGVFRAVGFRKRDIAKIVYLEAALLSVAGGTSGSIVGFALAALLPRVVGIKDVVVRPDLFILGEGILTALAVGMAASALPARRAAEMDPAEALKAL